MVVIGVASNLIRADVSRREVGAVQRDTASPPEPGELVVANVPRRALANVRGVTRRAGRISERTTMLRVRFATRGSSTTPPSGSRMAR